MLFSPKAGILPTPNSPKINSKNPNDYIKSSNYPIPFQAVNIAESFNINCQPTWDINVASKAVTFRAEWDLSGQVYSNSPSIDAFPKAVVSSLATYNLIQPVWNSSFNGKKLCIKIEWKISESLGHNIAENTTFGGQNPTIYTSNYPVNSPLNCSTPFQPSTPSFQADSGYKSPNISDIHNYSQVYYSPVYSRPNYHVNIDSKMRNSTAPRTNLFNSRRKPLDGQDIYIPQSKNIINCPRGGRKIPKSESTKLYSQSTDQQQSHASDKAEVSSIQSHVTEVASEINLDRDSVDNPDTHDHHIPPNESSTSQSANTPITTRISHHNPPDKSLPQSVSDDTLPPASEFTHIDPPKSHPPLINPAESQPSHSLHPPTIPPSPPNTPLSTPKPNVAPNSPTTKISQVSPSPPSSKPVTPTETTSLIAPQHPPPATQSPPTTLQPTLPKPTPDFSTNTNPLLNSHQHKSSESPKYTLSNKSTDRDIILIRDPKVDPMNCKYVSKPMTLPKTGKRKTSLDQKLDAGRMDIAGKCRFCGQPVSSCFADFHIITCQSFDESEVNEFYEEMAKLLSVGDNYDIQSIALNYCLYELHIAEYDINEFFDLKSFKTFITEIELFLDRRAATMFNKLGFTNSRRFNILTYP
jgi:hypothetical protein